MLTDITEAFGIDLLPEEERQAVLERISSVVFEGVMLRTIALLDDQKKEDLTRLFTEASDDPQNEEKQQAIQDFFEQQVPDFDKVVSAEIEALVHAPQDLFLDVE